MVLKEHEAAKWVNVENIWEPDWLPADLELVTEIERQLSNK